MSEKMTMDECQSVKAQGLLDKLYKQARMVHEQDDPLREVSIVRDGDSYKCRVQIGGEALVSAYRDTLDEAARDMFRGLKEHQWASVPALTTFLV
jgi:hypothetical protein